MTTLVWGVLFGAIGLGYFVYGRKQRHTTALVAGLGLMLFPYFVHGVAVTLIVGVALLAVPFLLRL